MKTLYQISTNILTKHAASLVAYAQKDDEFAAQLSSIFMDLTPSGAVAAKVDPTWIMPSDSLEAEARALWLKQELSLQPEAKSAEARAILTAWADEYIEPKNLVIGIVGVAVIGPTLGIVKRKKKKRKGMRVAITEKLAKAETGEILSVAQEASTTLLAQELGAVNGNTKRLDPDLADWLFAEPKTKLTTLDELEIKSLSKWMEKEKLPHYQLERNGKLLALAVSPCVSDDLELGDEL